MRSTITRVVLPCSLLIGIVSACASGGANQGGINPAPNGRSIVTSEDLERSPGQSIESILMSKVPGIIVSRGPDGSLAMQIRGPSSLTSSTDPLFIVDGAPFAAGPGGTRGGVPLGEHDQLRMRAAVLSVDGSRVLRVHGAAPGAQARQLGRDLAAELLGSGAGELMNERGNDAQ